MGFNSKLEFPEEQVEASGVSVDLHANVYENSVDGIFFANLNTSDVESISPFRPRIQTYFTTLNTARDALHNVRKVLYFPTTETDGTAIDAGVLDGYLAFSFANDVSCLVRTIREGTWIPTYTLATAPYAGAVTTFELRKILGGDTDIDGETVSWLAASEEDWDASRFPEGFSNEPSTLPGFVVFGDFITSFATQDIDLIPSDTEPTTLTETARFTVRHDKRIQDRSRFMFEDKEFQVNRFDVFDRGRKLSLEGTRQIERVVTV